MKPPGKRDMDPQTAIVAAVAVLGTVLICLTLYMCNAN